MDFTIEYSNRKITGNCSDWYRNNEEYLIYGAEYEDWDEEDQISAKQLQRFEFRNFFTRNAISPTVSGTLHS